MKKYFKYFQNYMLKTFSKKEAIIFGWQTVKNNFVFLVGILILVGLLNFLPDFFADLVEEKSFFISGIIVLLGGGLSIVVSMGLINIGLKLCDNKKAEINDLFSCYRLFFKYFFGTILYILIVLGGLVLLIVPGIILAIRFGFFYYFIVDQKNGPITALKKSFRLTEKNAWNLFQFFLILIGINLFFLLSFSFLMFVGIYSLNGIFVLPFAVAELLIILSLIFLFISVFVIAPTAIIAQVFVYRKLLKLKELSQNQEKVNESEKVENETNNF